jgi:hypothetical protein
MLFDSVPHYYTRCIRFEFRLQGAKATFDDTFGITSPWWCTLIRKLNLKSAHRPDGSSFPHDQPKSHQANQYKALIGADINTKLHKY